MATTIENLILKIKVEGQKALDSVTDSVKRLNQDGKKSIDGISNAIGNLGKDIGDLGTRTGVFGNSIDSLTGKLGPMGMAATATAGAIAALGFRTLEIVDSISDLSAATGINASSLMNFKQSLVAAGGSIDSFEKFASKLSVAIGEAADGNETYKKSFRELGVNTVDVNGQLRNSQVILEETIAALGKIEDPATRSRLAVALLGKEASKIDWSNVKAGKDAFTDKQFQDINRYNDALKALKTTIDRELIKAFGNLADAINNGGWVETIAAGVEELGKLVSLIPGLGKVNDLVTKARMERLGNRAGAGRGGQGGPTAAELAAYEAEKAGKDGGTAGRLGESAQLASAKRIADARADIDLQTALRTRDERLKIEAQLAAEILKITQDVNANEQLKGPEGAQQRAAEIQARTAAARAKAATQQYELENRITDQILQYRQQQEQVLENYTRTNIEAANQLTIQTRGIGLSEKELELYQGREAILTRSRALLTSLGQEVDKVRLTIGIDPNAETKLVILENKIKDVNDQTKIAIDTNQSYIKSLQDVREVEQRRLDTLAQTFARENEAIQQKSRLIDLTATQNERTIQAIKLQGELAAQQKIQEAQRKLGVGGVVPEDEQKRIRDEQQKTTDLLVKNAETQIAKSREFSTGWTQAYKQYVDDATNAASQATTYFNTFTKGFEDAIVRFVQTGKLSFKDLANSIIADFVRIQAKQIALGLFGGGKGDSGIFSIFSGLFGGGRALGGPVLANTPYMVGERGPELFVPKSAGTIVPNNRLDMGSATNTQVVYNINAVDAASFRQMLAREPEFLYAVTERGRSSIPGGRR